MKYTEGGSGEARSPVFGIANPSMKLTLVRPAEQIVAMMLNHEHA